MKKSEIKLEVEKMAKEMSISFVDAATAMQGAAAKMKSEKMIKVLHDLKMENLSISL